MHSWRMDDYDYYLCKSKVLFLISSWWKNDLKLVISHTNHSSNYAQLLIRMTDSQLQLLNLFRDIFSRLCFRSIARRRKAKSRMHYAKCLPLTNMIAIEPSNIMLTQAFGKNLPLLNESDKKEGTHLESTVQLDDVNI
ncbi:hypothetical protein X798_06133 [Onchocerca flexuosa]|uniref:Uncharacterized protein n=1 Tax=Onchocerca flexuosa TaxID=387005 RepID=A0A238BPC2_9BILA|nr:hypothetical protein X798_06133 [Onchocerca flexuosa]